jgi:hypothetical protein
MPATYQKIKVTEELLNQETGNYFVYGDNEARQGTAGAAALRTNPKAIGFITRRHPDAKPSSYFKPEEYIKPFFQQLEQLHNIIKNAPQQKFYISKIGSGASNKYYIWERVVKHNLIDTLGSYDNVVFCWEE